MKNILRYFKNDTVSTILLAVTLILLFTYFFTGNNYSVFLGFFALYIIFNVIEKGRVLDIVDNNLVDVYARRLIGLPNALPNEREVRPRSAVEVVFDIIFTASLFVMLVLFALSAMGIL